MANGTEKLYQTNTLEDSFGGDLGNDDPMIKKLQDKYNQEQEWKLKSLSFFDWLDLNLPKQKSLGFFEWLNGTK